ncbi:hypothetical protein QBC44DRAFT_403762 [Cladorrhinum sp. PSN332]|nr:hypothetical protein QBC44DRAFT_403762 [Cladorrhinum sp. PSN332]
MECGGVGKPVFFFRSSVEDAISVKFVVTGAGTLRRGAEDVGEEIAAMLQPIMTNDELSYRLENELVKAMQDSFLEHELGSATDAFFCIAPALGNRLSFDGTSLPGAIQRLISICRNTGRWVCRCFTDSTIRYDVADFYRAAMTEYTDNKREMTLCLAVAHGWTKVVRVLVREYGRTAHYSVNLPDPFGLTPLGSVAANGRTNIVRVLLTLGGLEVDRPNRSGDSPLIAAGMLGKMGVFSLLLRDKRPDPKRG